MRLLKRLCQCVDHSLRARKDLVILFVEQPPAEITSKLEAGGGGGGLL